MLTRKCCTTTIALLIITVISFAQTKPARAAGLLPGRYFELLDAGLSRIEEKLAAHPQPTLAALEEGHPFAHFPHAVLVAAALYATGSPANKHYHESRTLEVALQIGDLLAEECAKGTYNKRQDTDWDTYMWLEAYRLLKGKLGQQRQQQWQKAILDNLALLEPPLVKYQDYPWYNAPFIVTSPNHYSIYASALLVGGTVFHKPDWVKLATKVLHRYCVSEQTPDGYWGEHSQAGPTTGYDYVTLTQIALYWEYSKDPAAIKALRRSTDFHGHFTYLDGTPVETINDRNRYWGPSMWGHFGFSHFADGRRYAEFLTSFFPLHGDSLSYGGDLQSLGRIAQDVIYFHAGPNAPIPQDQNNYLYQMQVPGGVRKSGPWMTTYSGIIAPQVTINNFFLDRQGSFSVFNEKTGLIITGANSKRQPEIATFIETIDTNSIHIPVETKLEMGSADTLYLAYNVFFATLEFPKPAAGTLPFRIATNYKWGEAVAQMNLQLILKPGEEIENGSGQKIVLGKDSLHWGDKELKGIVRHHGWVMHLPAGFTFTWPYFPFNPYKDAPEADLTKAIGVLQVPLKLQNQQFDFSIDVP